MGALAAAAGSHPLLLQQQLLPLRSLLVLLPLLQLQLQLQQQGVPCAAAVQLRGPPRAPTGPLGFVDLFLYPLLLQGGPQGAPREPPGALLSRVPSNAAAATAAAAAAARPAAAAADDDSDSSDPWGVPDESAAEQQQLLQQLQQLEEEEKQGFKPLNRAQ
ncbi:hypothetical protein ETH_00036620 [Eimeria tenella]|uniref:Uncharacterized protein n=1 Tax=Eimeria tenella TaxID=5802 RepID=U6KZL7_EIMTE|nr:hypothetical protein ETH_00036620 [Eimeria tenella]CDJ40915.1 hypothetical protein ETH_00036620 [Eimeria tenella]|eukprot:XP_013231665.1 hypothetical protein ETH_00036620 [Eimeria tenella]